MESDTAKTYVFGDSASGLSSGLVPGMLMGAGLGGFGGGFGFGANSIGELIGLAVVASIFGWNNGGGFGFGNNGGAGTGFLSNQISDLSTRDLVLNAINGTDADVRALASTWNVDVESIKSGINVANSAIASLAAQQGVSTMQIINDIQSGNAALSRQLCECCCENRLLTTQQGYESRIATMGQTTALSDAISGSGQRTIDAIADLKTSMVKEFCDARERDMQNELNTKNEIISTLKGQIDNANQTAAITSYVNGLVSPLASKVDQIAAKQLPTVPVVYPNITAVNTTPYTGGFSYGAGFNPYGYGWGGNSYWG